MKYTVLCWVSAHLRGFYSANCLLMDQISLQLCLDDRSGASPESYIPSRVGSSRMVSKWVTPEQVLPFQYWPPKPLQKQAHSPLVPLTVTTLWAILSCLVRAAVLGKVSPMWNPLGVWKCLSTHWQNCLFWFARVLRNLGGKWKARRYRSIPGSPCCTPVLGTGSFLHPWASSVFWSSLLGRGQSTADFLYLVVLPSPVWAARDHGAYPTGGIKKTNMRKFSSDNLNSWSKFPGMTSS